VCHRFTNKNEQPNRTYLIGKVASQPRHRYGSAVALAQPNDIVVQHRSPWHAAKAVREPRPTNVAGSPYRVLAIFDLSVSFAILAHVAELADAYGSGPYGATRGGSSPLVSIN
jgi:hypothetical protein